MAFPATPLWGTFGGPAISAFPKTARGTSETVSWESKNLPGNPGSDSGRFGPHFRGARSAPEYSGPADAPQSFQKGIRGKLGGRPCDTGLHGARLPARAQPGFVRDARVAGFPSTSSAAAHEIGETPGSHVFAKVSARCFHFFCGIAPPLGAILDFIFDFRVCTAELGPAQCRVRIFFNGFSPASTARDSQRGRSPASQDLLPPPGRFPG